MRPFPVQPLLLPSRTPTLKSPSRITEKSIPSSTPHDVPVVFRRRLEVADVDFEVLSELLEAELCEPGTVGVVAGVQDDVGDLLVVVVADVVEGVVVLFDVDAGTAGEVFCSVEVEGVFCGVLR